MKLGNPALHKTIDTMLLSHKLQKALYHDFNLSHFQKKLEENYEILHLL
jgi:hypothetical protein